MYTHCLKQVIVRYRNSLLVARTVTYDLSFLGDTIVSYLPSAITIMRHTEKVPEDIMYDESKSYTRVDRSIFPSYLPFEEFEKDMFAKKFLRVFVDFAFLADISNQYDTVNNKLSQLFAI